MEDVISAPLFAGGLFLGMLACLEVGRRIGLWRLRKDPEAASQAGLGVVEGAFFGLFSLLVAFSFSGAAGRFDDRRTLIVEETNNIGTAYLRLDLLAPETQPALRDLFRRYVESRVATYRKIQDLDFNAATAEQKKTIELQGRIWSHAVAATRAPGSHPTAAMLLLPALNEMIDITTTRAMAAKTHPPVIIYRLLFGMGLLCAAIAGHGMAAASSRAWAHIVSFALIMSISIFVILDIEYPRLGFIRVDVHDQALAGLLESMK